MEQFKNAVTSIVGIVSILGLMVFLAISSCIDSPTFRAELCSDRVPCDVRLKQSPQSDARKLPTLAPPCINTLSTTNNSLRTPLLGQPVYVQVKTDRAEIEVGWASGDYLGR